MLVVWNEVAVVQMSIVIQMARGGGRLCHVNGNFKTTHLTRCNTCCWLFLVDSGCWLFFFLRYPSLNQSPNHYHSQHGRYLQCDHFETSNSRLTDWQGGQGYQSGQGGQGKHQGQDHAVEVSGSWWLSSVSRRLSVQAITSARSTRL